MTRGNNSGEFTVIQGGIVDAVPPPDGLPKACENDWNVVTSDLAARKLLSESTLGVVSAYCTALWQIRECTKVIEDLGMFVKGQNGVPKANPASSMMQKAQDTVNRLSVELSLTPSSRSKGNGGGGNTPAPGIGDFV